MEIDQPPRVCVSWCRVTPKELDVPKITTCKVETLPNPKAATRHTHQHHKKKIIFYLKKIT